MGFYASTIIKLAEEEVGYLEKATNSNLDSKTGNAGYGNYTKYARDIDNIPGFYNGKKNGYDWCDVFVDWLFVHSFGADEAKRLLCQPGYSCGAGVGWSAGYFESKGQLHKQPKPGDQIFFAKSNGTKYHTGLVYAVDDTKVYTIEGNTRSGSEIVSNGGMVCKKEYPLNHENIYAYGRPNYDTEPENNGEEETNMVNEIRYNTIEEMPDYAKATIGKLVNKGFLKGTGDGLDLSLDMVRMFVIFDRAGMFDEGGSGLCHQSE